MFMLSLPAGTPNRMKVLVKLPNYVGDIISSLPTLHAIRQTFPRDNHRVDLLTSPQYRDILYGHEDIFDEVLTPAWDAHGVKPWTVGLFLRHQRYDLVVSLSRQFRFLAGFWIAGIPLRTAYGATHFGVLVNHGLPNPKGDEGATEGQRRYFLALVKKRLNSNIDIDTLDKAVALKVNPRYESETIDIMQQGLFDDAQVIAPELRSEVLHREYYVVVPGAAQTPQGRLKKWPLWNFVEVARRLRAIPEGRDLIPVFSFGPDDQCLFDEFRLKYMNRDVMPGLTILLPPGRTRLGHMMMILASAQCRFVLSNDTGPRHMAIALGRQVVSIFGPTSLNRATYSSNLEFPVWVNVGCNLPECNIRNCCEDHICMTAVTPRLVLSKIMDFVFRVQSSLKYVEASPSPTGIVPAGLAAGHLIKCISVGSAETRLQPTLWDSFLGSGLQPSGGLCPRMGTLLGPHEALSALPWPISVSVGHCSRTLDSRG